MEYQIPSVDGGQPARLALDERPESLTALTLDAIRSAITDATLPPGARVTEAGLAAQLDVSKTPVREALLKLRQVGLIEEDGRRGWRVVRPSLERIYDAYEMREALEVFASRRAAEAGANDRNEAIVPAAQASLDGALGGSAELFRQWDSAFHLGVARATGNARLVEAIEDVHSLIVTLRQRDAPHLEFHVECAEAHLRIAEAICTGDVALAEQEARAHVHQVRDYVVTSFSQREAREAQARLR